MRKIVFDFAEVGQNELPIENNSIRTVAIKNDSVEEMFDYINSVMEGKSYGIGLHSTQAENGEGTLDSVMKKGLEIKEKQKILSTVSSFGTHSKIDKEHLKQRIMQYSYGKPGENKQNVIVLVPSTISNSQGKEIYLGFPPYDTECHGNNFRTSCVLDTICSSEESKGKIPSEFILGYYTNTNEGISFVKNPNYFKFLSEEQRDNFFSDIEGKLQGKYKDISDAVIAGDIQTLEEMSQEEQRKIREEIKEGTRNNILERGVNRQVAESLSENSVKIKQDDSATQALGYVERKKDKEETEIQPTVNKKRKFLFDSFRDVKLSDLQGSHGPKEILREGTKEAEKNIEGKEK